MKPEFKAKIHLHVEKPATPIDLALCLKLLPFKALKTTFQTEEVKQKYGE